VSLRKSVSKTVRLPRELFEVVRHRARQEKIDESTAIRQLLALGAENYAVELFRQGKITLSEAAGLAGVTVRQMIDVLQRHGIRGNVRLDQQQKALEFVKEL
jgi:predicted HTH domain antitoxin